MDEAVALVARSSVDSPLIAEDEPAFDPLADAETVEPFGDERDAEVLSVIASDPTTSSPTPSSGNIVHDALVGIYPAGILADREFPPLRSYVEGLIVEGLGVIGGKPKLGKSWLVASIAASIASGGVALGNPARSVTKSPTLYLALEDGERRMQSRLHRLCPDGIPANLSIAHDWPRLDLGGLDAIEAAVEANGFGVIFIDTLQKVRQPRKGRDMYGEDYEALGALHDLTRRIDGLAIYMVHHNRKDDRPDDYIDALSGSTGLTGSPDLVAVLARGRGEADAVLSITGRDVTEDERALSFDSGLWTELGSSAEHAVSKARRDTLVAVEAITATGEPVHALEIAEYTGKSRQNASKMLHKLASEGLLRQVDRGAFVLPDTVASVARLTRTQPNQPTQPPPLVEALETATKSTNATQTTRAVPSGEAAGG